MEHDDAIRTHAAERYLLGEMSSEERDSYEEHYFSCEQCAAEVSASVAFRDNARTALAHPLPADVPLDRRGPTLSWTRLFTLRPLVPALSAAALLLFAVAAYQGLAVIPELREQLAARDRLHSVPTVALRSASRGAGPRLVVHASDRYVVLQADVLPERRVAMYAVSLLAPDGSTRVQTAVAAPEPGLPVTLLVSADNLSPGDYTLVVRDEAAPQQEIGRFVFTVDTQ
jgi:anti-sigma factor RsiW